MPYINISPEVGNEIWKWKMDSKWIYNDHQIRCASDKLVPLFVWVQWNNKLPPPSMKLCLPSFESSLVCAWRLMIRVSYNAESDSARMLT